MSRFTAVPFVGATLAVVLAGPGCVNISAAQYSEREDKKFTVSGKPEVSLSTFDGSIEVRGTNGPDVAVTIEKRAMTKSAADRIDIRVEQTGNHIVVDVRMPKGERILGWHQSASANLIVSVPVSTD